MGICFQKEKTVEVSKTDNRKMHNPSHSNKNQIAEKNFSQKDTLGVSNWEVDDVKDMEEWEGDRYKGEGVKKMKAYKCDLNIDELAKMRENFWATKVKNKHIWKVLKIASMTDHVKSENLLRQNNIRTLNGCMNFCVDLENNTYHIPNYCINDPYFEKELLPQIETKQADELAKLEIYLYDLYENKRNLVKLPSNILGKEIKAMFADMNNFNLEEYKIRLLYGGAEILDDQYLYQHKMKDGFTIQIVKNQI